MADKLISQLGATAGVVSTDVFEIEKLAGPPSEKATIAQLITLLNTIYAPVTGGNYVLKSGDTMTGPLLFSADNTVDIGASGATRPRDFFLGRNLTVGGTSRLVGGIVDGAALNLLTLTGVATAVNWLELSNAATGTGPVFTAMGTDASVSVNLNPKGTGSLITNAALFRMTNANSTVLAAAIQLNASGAAGKSYMTSGTDGNITFFDNGGSTFGLLQFGGTAATFPAIKRSTTVLQARLANDSAFGTFQGILQVSVNATAAAPPVTTHTIPMTDAAGQVYRVPCLV